MGLCEPRPDGIPGAVLAPLSQLCIYRLPRRKVGWEITPPTIRFYHMDDCLKHQASIVVVGMPNAPNGWEQWHKPLPHHVEHIPIGKLLHLWRLVHWSMLRKRTILAPAVMVITRPGLMPPPPPRPRQHSRGSALDRQDQLPKQPPNFGTTQSDRSPRRALKLAKRLVVSTFGCPFFGATSAPLSARMSVKKAWAHIATVMWRYHPVKERTS